MTRCRPFLSSCVLIAFVSLRVSIFRALGALCEPGVVESPRSPISIHSRYLHSADSSASQRRTLCASLPMLANYLSWVRYSRIRGFRLIFRVSAFHSSPVGVIACYRSWSHELRDHSLVVSGRRHLRREPHRNKLRIAFGGFRSHLSRRGSAGL